MCLLYDIVKLLNIFVPEDQLIKYMVIYNHNTFPVAILYNAGTTLI